jgi:hypothetical protein
MKLLIMQFSPASCYFLVCPSILLSILFSYTLSLCVPFHTHEKLQAELQFRIFFIFTFLYSR